MQTIVNWFLLLLFPVILLIGIIWINVSAVLHYTKVKKLERNGMVTKAKVTDKKFNTYTKGPNTYYIEYRYSATDLDGNSKVFDVKKEVDENLYELSYVGQELEISYQKDKIEVSDLVGNENYIKTIITIVFIDLLLIFGLIYFFKNRT